MDSSVSELLSHPVFSSRDAALALACKQQMEIGGGSVSQENLVGSIKPLPGVSLFALIGSQQAYFILADPNSCRALPVGLLTASQSQGGHYCIVVVVKH